METVAEAVKRDAGIVENWSSASQLGWGRTGTGRKRVCARVDIGSLAGYGKILV
jgi:hypothetical protein